MIWNIMEYYGILQGVEIKLDGVISQYYNDDSVEVKLTEW